MNDEDTGPMEFDTFEAAFEWMEAIVDDPYIDNQRSCYTEIPEQVAAFIEAQKRGCCGNFDADVIIGGLPARSGCNYGH